jgi:hypothetical protein
MGGLKWCPGSRQPLDFGLVSPLNAKVCTLIKTARSRKSSKPRPARRKSRRAASPADRKSRTDRLFADSLTGGAPEIGGSFKIDRKAHRLRAALYNPFNAELPSKKPARQRPMENLIQTVLRDRVPEWREQFPAHEESLRAQVRKKGKRALGQDPRTKDLPLKQIRHSFWRAVGWKE